MKRFHGIFSLFLMSAASALAFAVILMASTVAAVVYTGTLALSVPLILFSYCAKCNCRADACGHVLPGKLTRFFPARKPGPYSGADFSGVAIPLLTIVLFPQFWLWQSKELFAIFWIIVLAAGAEILIWVCRKCENRNCPLRASGRLYDTNYPGSS